MISIWDNVKIVIKNKVPEHSYKLWIEPIKFCKSNNNGIVLSCPNDFSKKQVIKRYKGIFLSVFEEVVKQHLPIKFIVEKKRQKKIIPCSNIQQISLPGMELRTNLTKKLTRELRKDFTFDQFVVGSNNDFAFSAALSIASRKTSEGLNSLFLFSKTGLGKSHLSQAVGHHIISHFPKKRVFYVTVEDFTSEMVASYRNNDIGQFKEKYKKKCDVLLIDDIQYLSGKNGTQQELTNILDFLMDTGKKIIFASSELPSNIPKLNDKLKSRLSSSLISNLEPPDYEMRAKILKKKSKNSGYNLPGEVIKYLAGEISGDIRQLESGLIGVATKASLLGINPDLIFAEKVVKNIISSQEGITLDFIKNLVCKHYNITIKDLISKSRRKSIVWPRQIAMYLSRRYTDHSLQSIGKGFNKYHATCMYALKTVATAIDSDISVQKQIEVLSKDLESKVL